MPQDQLRPADPDELRFSLSLALRHDGRKRYRMADEQMANITADHLLRWLERSNYVVMQKPPRQPHSTPGSGQGTG